MKKKNAMIEALSRVWPTKHQQFQEMSALAATGQLGGAQMCELDEHIGRCESCREFLHSVAQIGVQAMPLLADRHSPTVEAVPPAGMRARFVSRIEAEQLQNMVEAAPRSHVLAIKPPANPSADKNSRRSFGLLRYTSALAACLVIGAVGFYAGQWKGKERPPQSSPTHSPMPVVRRDNVGTNDVDPIPQLQQQKIALETQLTETKQKLSAAETDQDVLEVETNKATMNVTAEGGQFKVRVPIANEQDVSSWVNSEVLIEGVCGSLFNGERQLIGVLFYVPRLSFIKVERTAKEVPFSALLQFSPDSSTKQRVQVRGVVGYQQPGNALFLQSQGNGISDAETHAQMFCSDDFHGLFRVIHFVPQSDRRQPSNFVQNYFQGLLWRTIFSSRSM